MQKRGTAAEISLYEEWLFDGLLFVAREKQVIQEKEKPCADRENWPDCVKNEQEFYAFGLEFPKSVFGFE